MRLVPLLFDPRGAVDRAGFWSGLLQLTVVSLMVYFGLTGVEGTVSLAALPLIGETFVASLVAGGVYGADDAGVVFAASLALVAARLYATACLMLKRARDAGRSSGTVVVFGVSSLLVHVLAGLWGYSLSGEGMAVIVPMIFDLAVTGALAAAFVAWLGALRSSSFTRRVVAG